jgi:DUF4097 and DUF4098 domain-containing protein YvlB
VDIAVGDVRIVAGDRTDTVVEVRPANSATKSDVAAAQQTRVEFDGGRLLIKGPKGWRRYTLRGGGDAIDVEIALPVGSHVRGEIGVGTLRCTGRLGECRFATGMGAIQLDQAGAVQLKTGVGDIIVDREVGTADVSTGSGAVHIGAIDGAAVVKNANGDTWIGTVAGDLRVHAARGKILVDRAQATVAAKTAYGDVRLGEVSRGAVVASTALGTLDVGIREGTAAWLDLHTQFGSVHNALDVTEQPQRTDDTVEVRARTACGDITIRRAQPLATHAAANRA